MEMKSEIGGRKAEGRHLCQGNVWQGNLNPSGGTPLEPASGDGCATGWMALPGGASQSWGLSELVPPSSWLSFREFGPESVFVRLRPTSTRQGVKRDAFYP